MRVGPPLRMVLLLDNSRFLRGMATAVTSMGSLQHKAQATASSLTGLGASLTLGLTAPVVGLGLLSVSAFSKFNAAMTESLAIFEGVTDDMRRKMGGAAMDMSAHIRASSDEIARSYFYLGSAGLSAQKSLESLPIVARFGQAGMFDMARATELAVDAQRTMGLFVENSAQNMANLTRVTDVFTKANTLANATTAEFSEAIVNDYGPALRAMNKDVEEGAAVLAVLANTGFAKGTEAGTQAAINLRDMQKAAILHKRAWDYYGLSIYDSTGKMLNMADVVDQLTGLLDNMSDKQKWVTLMQLGFQFRSVKATQALLGFGDKIREYEAVLRSAGGTTEKIANRQMEAFRNQIKLMRNALFNLRVVIGEQLAPVLGKMASKVKNVAAYLRKMDKDTLRFYMGVLGLAAAVGPLILLSSVLIKVFIGLGAALLTLPFRFLQLGSLLAFPIKMFGELTAVLSSFIHMGGGAVSTIMKSIAGSVLNGLRVAHGAMIDFASFLARWLSTDSLFFGKNLIGFASILKELRVKKDEVASFWGDFFAYSYEFWRDNIKNIFDWKKIKAPNPQFFKGWSDFLTGDTQNKIADTVDDINQKTSLGSDLVKSLREGWGKYSTDLTKILIKQRNEIEKTKAKEDSFFDKTRKALGMEEGLGKATQNAIDFYSNFKENMELFRGWLENNWQGLWMTAAGNFYDVMINAVVGIRDAFISVFAMITAGSEHLSRKALNATLEWTSTPLQPLMFFKKRKNKAHNKDVAEDTQPTFWETFDRHLNSFLGDEGANAAVKNLTKDTTFKDIWKGFKNELKSLDDLPLWNFGIDSEEKTEPDGTAEDLPPNPELEPYEQPFQGAEDSLNNFSDAAEKAAEVLKTGFGQQFDSKASIPTTIISKSQAWLRGALGGVLQAQETVFNGYTTAVQDNTQALNQNTNQQRGVRNDFQQATSTMGAGLADNSLWTEFQGIRGNVGWSTDVPGGKPSGGPGGYGTGQDAQGLGAEQLWPGESEEVPVRNRWEKERDRMAAQNKAIFARYNTPPVQVPQQAPKKAGKSGLGPAAKTYFGSREAIGAGLKGILSAALPIGGPVIGDAITRSKMWRSSDWGSFGKGPEQRGSGRIFKDGKWIAMPGRDSGGRKAIINGEDALSEDVSTSDFERSNARRKKLGLPLLEKEIEGKGQDLKEPRKGPFGSIEKNGETLMWSSQKQSVDELRKIAQNTAQLIRVLGKGIPATYGNATASPGG